MSNQKRNSVLQFLLTFAVVYLVSSMALRFFLPDKFGGEKQEPPPIVLRAPKSKAPIGRNVQVILQNNTDKTLTLEDRCPDPPVIIERESEEKYYEVELGDPVMSCTPLTEIAPATSVTIDLSPWKYTAFQEVGTYSISVPSELLEQVGMTSAVQTNITITKPGIIVALFRAFISKPLLNGLVLIASVIPNHSLGWSIIILTLIVKILLLLPSQHALESQKKMQAIQPKLDELKKKHKGDQQKITEETMALWKREKINPMQSCLPTFIQIPILLGLFAIIRDSNSVELAQHLLYPPFQHLTWTFTHTFLGFLDLGWVPFAGITWWPSVEMFTILLKGSPIPLALGLAQFAQMKMMFALRKDPKKPQAKKTIEEHMNPQNMMQYLLPVMIFFISGRMPVAVSLYWGTSTVFSVVQQLVLNRKK